MDTPTGYPSHPTGRALAMLFIGFSHLALGLGGLVRADQLAALAAAENSSGLGAMDWWALLFSPFAHPAAPIILTVLWSALTGALFYWALRRLFGVATAVGFLAAVTVAGYPSFSRALPTPLVFWLLPAALALLVLSLFLAGPLGPLQLRLARPLSGRRGKIVFWLVIVTALFFTAEGLRLALRGARIGEFPYAQNGYRRGFDPSLDDLRRFTHARYFLEGTGALRKAGLLTDNRIVCLAGHGPAARGLCRAGLARPDRLPIPDRSPRLSPAGWRIGFLDGHALPSYGIGGVRYARFFGKVDGKETGDFYKVRDAVWNTTPEHVELTGPLYRRAANEKEIHIEVETRDPEGVAVKAFLNEMEVNLVRRELAAGDRVIVRLAAPTPDHIGKGGVLLFIDARDRSGMLDFDFYIHSRADDRERPTPLHRSLVP